MARASDAAFAATCWALAAVLFLGFPYYSGTSAPAVVQVALPLALTAAAALFASVALVSRHLRHAAGGLPKLVTFALCASTGTLQYVLFVEPYGAGFVVVNINVAALGLAAATVTFFLGMATVLVLVGAGEGGRRGAGYETVVRALSKLALGAAAALIVGIIVVTAAMTSLLTGF